MLSNAEIRERFFDRSILIDRHGNFIGSSRILDNSRAGFCSLLHYHVLDGLSDDAARKTLKEYDLSELEIEFVLRKTKEFIENVLELPLDEIREASTSTEAHIWRRLTAALGSINLFYDSKLREDYLYQGKKYQVDEASRHAMEEAMKYGPTERGWITANNDPVTLTHEDFVKILHGSYLRNEELVREKQKLKADLRSAAEKGDFALVQELLEKVSKL